MAKILLALYYKGSLSQTDIANDYGMPLTTVATIVKKHEMIQGKTEQQNIQDDRFIIVKKAETGKHRTKLVLTDYGKEKAEKIWGNFMKDVLGNMKTIDNKSPDAKYGYLSKIFNSVGHLYNYTVGTKNILHLGNKRLKKVPKRVFRDFFRYRLFFRHDCFPLVEFRL